jgi:hypothetical protein
MRVVQQLDYLDGYKVGSRVIVFAGPGCADSNMICATFTCSCGQDMLRYINREIFRMVSLASYLYNIAIDLDENGLWPCRIA